MKNQLATIAFLGALSAGSAGLAQVAQSLRAPTPEELLTQNGIALTHDALEQTLRSSHDASVRTSAASVITVRGYKDLAGSIETAADLETLPANCLALVMSLDRLDHSEAVVRLANLCSRADVDEFTAARAAYAQGKHSPELEAQRCAEGLLRREDLRKKATPVSSSQLKS